MADVTLKRTAWGPASDRWFPGGPEDPNVVIVKLITDRIELWSSGHDVMPEPQGLSSAVLVRDERDASGWRHSVTFQPSS